MAKENERIGMKALEDEVVKLRKMVESQLEQCEETGVQMESALRKVGYQLENIEVSCEAARQREVWQRNRERDVNRRRQETETKLGGDHDALAVKVSLLEEEQKSAARKMSLMEESQRNNPQNLNPTPTPPSPASLNTFCCNLL